MLTTFPASRGRGGAGSTPSASSSPTPNKAGDSGFCVQKKHDGVRAPLQLATDGVRITAPAVSDVTSWLGEHQANCDDKEVGCVQGKKPRARHSSGRVVPDHLWTQMSGNKTTQETAEFVQNAGSLITADSSVVTIRMNDQAIVDLCDLPQTSAEWAKRNSRKRLSRAPSQGPRAFEPPRRRRRKTAINHSSNCVPFRSHSGPLDLPGSDHLNSVLYFWVIFLRMSSVALWMFFQVSSRMAISVLPV
jgi:hypothetical protein